MTSTLIPKLRKILKRKEIRSWGIRFTSSLQTTDPRCAKIWAIFSPDEQYAFMGSSWKLSPSAQFKFWIHDFIPSRNFPPFITRSTFAAPEKRAKWLTKIGGTGIFSSFRNFPVYSLQKRRRPLSIERNLDDSNEGGRKKEKWGWNTCMKKGRKKECLKGKRKDWSCKSSVAWDTFPREDVALSFCPPNFSARRVSRFEWDFSAPSVYLTIRGIRAKKSLFSRFLQWQWTNRNEFPCEQKQQLTRKWIVQFSSIVCGRKRRKKVIWILGATAFPSL